MVRRDVYILALGIGIPSYFHINIHESYCSLPHCDKCVAGRDGAKTMQSSWLVMPSY